MPRTFDRRFQPRNDKDPNRFGTDFSDPFGAIEESGQLAGSFIRDNLVYAIKESTGIDLTGVTEFMDFIVAEFGELLSLENWLEIIEQLVAFFADLIDSLELDPFPVLGDVIQFFAELGDRSGFLEMLNQLVEFFLGLLNAETFLATLGDIVEFFTGEGTILAKLLAAIEELTGLDLGSPAEFVASLGTALTDLITGGLATVAAIIQAILDLTGLDLSSPAAFIASLGTALTDLFGVGGALIAGIVTAVIDAINTLLGGDLEDLGALLAGLGEIVTNIVHAFTGIAGGSLTDIEDWVKGVPLIPTLVSILTGKTEADNVALDMGTLNTWAKNLLNGVDSKIPAGNLVGQISEAMLGIVPVSAINVSTPNLLAQGGFDVAANVATAGGFSWDGTESYPASATSGSVKATCTGSAQNLYSTQSIMVTAGDRLNLSAWVKTASYTGTGSSIQISLIPFIGTTAQSAQVFASRGASNGTWVNMVGASTFGPWTVPASITSVRVRLSTTAPAGSFVWFDNVALTKSGLLGQSLVQSLIDAWNLLWDGFTGGGGGTTNKTFADMFTGAGLVRTVGTTAQQGLNTTNTKLTYYPETIIGNLFSVVADGTVTMGGMLAKIFDALGGTVGSATKTAANVYTVGALLKLLANNTNQSLGTQTTNLSLYPQNVIGNLFAVIVDGAVTMAGMLAKIFDGLKGTTGATSKTAAEVYTAGALLKSLQALATQGLQNTNTNLFGITTAGSTVLTTALPLDAIAAAVNPTSGSGALLIRTTAGRVAAGANGANKVALGFFNSLSVSSSDIQCITSSGAAATGVRNDYIGRFRATITGWYMVEIAYKVFANESWGFNLAPLLYRNGSEYKIGTDVMYTWASGGTFAGSSGAQRYAQSTFIVYLAANDYVEAGYNVYIGTALNRNVLGATTSTGTETYFSMSLLNRSYA